MVTVIIFLLVRLTGDPLNVILPEEASPEMYEQTARALGLDQPLHVQYVRFLTDIAEGDFGTSHRTRGPVLPLLISRIPATLELSLAALVVAFATAIPLGMYAAYWRGGWLDFTARSTAVFGQSMPPFLLGLLLILLFAVTLGVLPAGGRGTPAHLVLPAVTLAWVIAAGLTRLMRSSLLEVLQLDYITVARAKGVSERRVLWRHSFRNAAVPVLTFGGVLSANLLTGSIVTETVFAWPGMGRLVVDSITARDFPVVQGAVVLLSAVYITLNLVVDALYIVVNPRLRA